MKKRGIVLFVLACLAVSFSACNDDDDNNNGQPDQPGQPETAVTTAFNGKYPGAAGVEWETQGMYQKADFIYQSAEREAWFYKDGTWMLTISQLSYAALPAAVSQAVAGGIYAGWTPVQEAQLFEPALLPVAYIVEVDRQGSDSRELYCSADGLLRKEVNEDYDANEMPSWMSSFLKQKYPQALLLQGEKILDGMYTAYLLNGRHFCTTWFYRDQTWNYTGWPVEKNDVPAVVLNVLKGAAYQDFLIRSVEYRQTSSGDYYYFDLYREGSLDVKVKITPQGELVLNRV